MASDETEIQIFADWPMSSVKHMTKDNRKNPEYHIVVAARSMLRDKNCPAEKSGPTMTTLFSGFYPLSFVTRFTCDISQSAKIWV